MQSSARYLIESCPNEIIFEIILHKLNKYKNIDESRNHMRVNTLKEKLLTF